MYRLIVVFAALLLFATPAGATYQFFPANHPITGAAAVDAIDCDGGVGPPAWEACATGDVAFVVTTGNDVCIYVMNDTSACGGTSAEDPCPVSIQPEDTAPDKADQCWELADPELEQLIGMSLSGADVEIITGTGSTATDTYVAVWNADGDLVDGPGVPYVVGGDDVIDDDVVNALTINAGTVDATPIGGTAPAAGEFTTLEAGSGALTVDAAGNLEAPSITTTKVSGTAGKTCVYESATTGTEQVCWQGPTGDMANNINYVLPLARPTAANGIMAFSAADTSLASWLYIGTDIQAYSANTTVLGSTIGASEVDADMATQAELTAVAELVDTDDEIIAIINASPGTDINVAAGGTGVATLTDHGVLVGSGTADITALTVGTNGQLLIGSAGADPVFAALTCDDDLTCTAGAGTLEIDLDASPGVTTLTAGTSVVTPLLDAAGDEDMDYGSADVDDHTFVTDGTGDAEIVLPADSIGPAEIDSTTGAYDFGGVTTLEIPNSDDPDTTATGQIALDTDGWLRVYQDSLQKAVPLTKSIAFTVILPNDLADSERDALWVWTNTTGMSFIVTKWTCQSDTDDTTLNLETTTGSGGSNATVDAVEIASNGTSMFYATDSNITAGTIADGSLLLVDFDDTDTPGQVSCTVDGYLDGNVN